MFFRRVVSVVMLSWKRPDNVARIVAALRRNALVDDVLVWHSHPEAPLPELEPDADLALVRTSRDLGMNARWAASVLARHDAVLMQDDDVLLSDAALRRLYEAWWHDPDVIHAIWGRNPDASGAYQFEDAAAAEAEIALTRALIFHRRHAGAFLELRERLDPAIARLAERDGEDIVFSYAVMARTGRRQRIHDLRGEVRSLPQPHAIGDAPDHRAVRTRVVRACREALGLAPAPARPDPRAG
jgi:hypothetical protein